MDAVAERIRAQFDQRPTSAEVQLTSDELHGIYLRGNDRAPLPRDLAENSIVNVVVAEDQWRKFCEYFKDPQGRDWLALLQALCWKEKGILDAYARWFMRRRKGSITSLDTVRRYLRDVSALFLRFQGDTLDDRVRDYMRQVAVQEIAPKFGLRTEPKHKNIMGPRGFTYLVHFAWTRSRKPFKIGLDRVDYVLCRMILMWTGCRSHELVLVTRNAEKYVKRYLAQPDAFAKVDNGADKYMEKIPKTCWACGRIDDRTKAQYKVLCWEDITVRILSDPEKKGGRDMFAMDVLLRFHKNHNSKTVPTIYHFIEDPYPLLCPIVYVIGKAYSEGIIDWEALGMEASGLDLNDIITKLFSTKIQQPSVEIPWKKEFWHTPVFRRTTFAPDGRPFKSDDPVTKAMFDNEAKREGREAGLPDNPQSYDYRRGNLEVLDTHYRTSVRNRGARHRPGTNVYETYYVGQGMRAICQDAFLGRGTHSPLTDILNHVGLRYDETAPTLVTDEMMRLIGPDSSILRLEEEMAALQNVLEAKYGKPSLATGADKEKYANLQNQLKVAKQRHSRRVLTLVRKDHFTTKNNQELGRQLSGETELLEPAKDIKPVHFTVPERRKLAAIFGDFDDNLSEERIVRNRIDATTALIRYAWIVERDDQAVLVEAPETEVVCKPSAQRPWFASMIRDPVNPRTRKPKREDSSTAPETPASVPPAKVQFTCMFCGKTVKQRHTMWNCVDKHITKLKNDAGAVACPQPGCKMHFENEMRFKHHAGKDHNIPLRPAKKEKGTGSAPLCSLSKAYCSSDSSSIPSSPRARPTAGVDMSYALDPWIPSTETLATNELIMSPYPELPDTTDSADPGQHQPVSHGETYQELDTTMLPIEEDTGPWEPLQTGLHGNMDPCGQLEEAGWESVTLPLLDTGVDTVNDARLSLESAVSGTNPQATSTVTDLGRQLFDVELLDPALRGHDEPRSAPTEPEDIEMAESASIHDETKEYPVESLLEKRGNMFYIQWKDGTRSWEHRDQISDDLITPFEVRWKGYHLGVDVMYRKPTGRACFRVRFKDWPWENTTVWAAHNDLSPELRTQWPSKPRRRGRRPLH